MYSMRVREYDVAGAANTPLPLNTSTYSAYWTIRGELSCLLRNMSLSKQARKRTFEESWEEKYVCCAQDDNVRCLLSSIVQKDTHKWNIRRYYDIVLCIKSSADAANLHITSCALWVALWDVIVRLHWVHNCRCLLYLTWTEWKYD